MREVGGDMLVVPNVINYSGELIDIEMRVAALGYLIISLRSQKTDLFFLSSFLAGREADVS